MNDPQEQAQKFAELNQGCTVVPRSAVAKESSPLTSISSVVWPVVALAAVSAPASESLSRLAAGVGPSSLDCCACSALSPSPLVGAVPPLTAPGALGSGARNASAVRSMSSLSLIDIPVSSKSSCREVKMED